MRLNFSRSSCGVADSVKKKIDIIKASYFIYSFLHYIIYKDKIIIKYKILYET